MALRHTLMLVLSATVLLGASASKEPVSRQAEWQTVISTLENEATADSLVTAAFLRHAKLKDADGALDLVDRALLLAPKQADLAWLALSLCAEIKDCAVAPRAEVVSKLDPGNAAAFYPALTEARNAADVAAEDRALAAMAEAGYFDIYWSRLISRVADTVTQPREGQRSLRVSHEAASEVIGWVGAVIIPPFNAIGNTCSGDRLKRDDILAHCRKLAVVLDNGDGEIAQSVGRKMASRVWPAESAEAGRFRDEARKASYVSEMIRPFDNAALDSEANARRWLDVYRTNRRERDVYLQLLKDHGIPPDPPADWVPQKAVASGAASQ